MFGRDWPAGVRRSVALRVDIDALGWRPPSGRDLITVDARRQRSHRVASDLESHVRSEILSEERISPPDPEIFTAMVLEIRLLALAHLQHQPRLLEAHPQ